MMRPRHPGKRGPDPSAGTVAANLNAEAKVKRIPAVLVAGLALAGCADDPIDVLAPPASADLTHGGLHRLVVPGDVPAGGPPVFFAHVYDDGRSDWVPVLFFRDPALTPEGENLLILEEQGNFMTRSAAPRTVEGFVLIEAPPFPALARFTNPVGETVPVWLVSRQDFEAAAADDVVTRAELQAMPSLLMAEATHLTFVASPGSNVPTIQTSAGGVLPDGRRFQVTLVYDFAADVYRNFNLRLTGQGGS